MKYIRNTLFLGCVLLFASSCIPAGEFINPGPSFAAEPKRQHAATGNARPENWTDNTVAWSTIETEKNTASQSLAPFDSAPVVAGLTLDQAVSTAVSTHPTVAASVHMLAGKGYLVTEAKSAWYPQVGLVGNTRYDSEDNESLTPTIQVSQRVWDFGKVSAEVGQAEAMVDRQSAEAMAAVDSIIQQTADALINLHQYQRQLEAAREWVAKSKEFEDMTRYRMRVGLAAEADVMQATTRLEAARSNLQMVETLIEQFQEQIYSLAGLRVEGPVQVSEADLATRVDLSSDDVSRNTLVLGANADYRLATAQRDSARASGLPTVDVVASTGRTLVGRNPNTGRDEDHYSSVGLNVTQSLFDGGAVAARRNAATSSLASAARSRDASRRQAMEQARVLRSEILGLKARLGILASRTNSIRVTRELYQEQYTLGARPVLDLLNAEQEYYQAVSEELSASHRLLTNLIAYAVNMGQGRSLFGLQDVPGL